MELPALQVQDVGITRCARKFSGASSYGDRWVDQSARGGERRPTAGQAWNPAPLGRIRFKIIDAVGSNG